LGPGRIWLSMEAPCLFKVLTLGMTRTLIDFLQLYRPIPKKDQTLIGSSFEYKMYNEGESLTKPGHIVKHLFFICRGVLRIRKTNEDGRDSIHFFLKENQFCSILDSFNNEVIAEENIEAAVSTEVLVISKTRLIELYKAVPYLKSLIDEINSQRLLEKLKTRNAYLGLDSTARYRLFLNTQPDIALKVSLTDIASYLGITPQSLSRIRKNLMVG
jgi:CRP/FNR family transcriptional regulator, anaerobic regulatory protein